MIGTDVMNMDDMDAIVNAFNNDDMETFMKQVDRVVTQTVKSVYPV